MKGTIITLKDSPVVSFFLVLLLAIHWIFSDAATNTSMSAELIIDEKKWWRLLTCAVTHNDWNHLFSNAFFLYLYGTPLEKLHGSRPLFFTIIQCILCLGALELLITCWLTSVLSPMYWAVWYEQSVGFSGVLFALITID